MVRVQVLGSYSSNKPVFWLKYWTKFDDLLKSENIVIICSEQKCFLILYQIIFFKFFGGGQILVTY